MEHTDQPKGTVKRTQRNLGVREKKKESVRRYDMGVWPFVRAYKKHGGENETVQYLTSKACTCAFVKAVSPHLAIWTNNLLAIVRIPTWRKPAEYRGGSAHMAQTVDATISECQAMLPTSASPANTLFHHIRQQH